MAGKIEEHFIARSGHLVRVALFDVVNGVRAPWDLTGCAVKLEVTQPGGIVAEWTVTITNPQTNGIIEFQMDTNTWFAVAAGGSGDIQAVVTPPSGIPRRTEVLEFFCEKAIVVAA